MSRTVCVAFLGSGTELKPSERALVTLAREIGDVTVVLFGEQAQTLVHDCAEYGARRVVIASTPRYSHALAIYADALSHLVLSEQPSVVLMENSADTKEILGRVAVLSESPIFTDISGIQFTETNDVMITQEVLGGSTIVTSHVFASTVLATAQPNIIEAYALPVPEKVESLHVTPSGVGDSIKVIQGARSSGDNRPQVTDARIIVAAGRGVGEKEDFESLVLPLADILNSAVGASRAAIDNEWCGRENLIGQSGHTVSPDVYIALGISGAIHHRAGMQNAKHVIAVNTDADAPMVNMADLGVVGDVHQVIPQLISCLREHYG